MNLTDVECVRAALRAHPDAIVLMRCFNRHDAGELLTGLTRIERARVCVSWMVF